MGEKVAEGRMRVAEAEQNLPGVSVTEHAESPDFCRAIPVTVSCFRSRSQKQEAGTLVARLDSGVDLARAPRSAEFARIPLREVSASVKLLRNVPPERAQWLQ